MNPDLSDSKTCALTKHALVSFSLPSPPLLHIHLCQVLLKYAQSQPLALPFYIDAHASVFPTPRLVPWGLSSRQSHPCFHSPLFFPSLLVIVLVSPWNPLWVSPGFVFVCVREFLRPHISICTWIPSLCLAVAPSPRLSVFSSFRSKRLSTLGSKSLCFQYFSSFLMQNFVGMFSYRGRNWANIWRPQ